jgi:hypothetical protein
VRDVTTSTKPNRLLPSGHHFAQMHETHTKQPKRSAKGKQILLFNLNFSFKYKILFSKLVVGDFSGVVQLFAIKQKEPVVSFFY